MENSTSMLDRLKESKVFKVVSGYALVAFITVQIASLVTDSFGFGQEFMQNIIIVFLVILPFIALIAWAASSKYGTFKILGISLFILFTGYGTGSYIWVNNFMLPQVKSFLEKDDNVEAWLAASRINSFAPFFSTMSEDNDNISALVNLQIQQDGVNVSWKAYGEENEWRFLGKSPLPSIRLPRGILQFKLDKEGYETTFFSSSNPSLKLNNFPIDMGWNVDPINLQVEGSIPKGMIYIPGGNFIPALTGSGVDQVYLHPFYIDKFEVTNKEFKEFVDAGGYKNPQYWVEMDFIRDGVSLTLEEAQELMTDTTGMVGPAGWEVGTYIQGTEDKPVTGVSWYEALAYARYKGNILPPMFHWAKAAFPPDEIISPISPKLLKTSNFSKEDISVVGQGEGAYGTFDMAGNAKEWVWNIFGGRGLTLGGAFDEPTYLASQTAPEARMNRSLKNGFRTARLINPKDLNPFGDPIETQAPKDLSFYKPMSDEVFNVYSRSFQVSSTNPKFEKVYIDDSHPVWIKERIKLEVGYNNESMDVLIFRPKNSFGLSAPIIVHPGANYYTTPPEIDDINPGEFSLDFLIKSGKTLIWPAWKGSLNRMPENVASNEDTLRRFRNQFVAWVNDTDKTLDYLETRNDIDTENIFYLGMSYGALFNTHTLLFENRYKGAILYVGGSFPTYPPLADGINHLPRIKTPFLMLNGEQDYLVPKSAANFFYQFTGTPTEDKKIIFYDSGHWPLPRNQMIKETLSFIDKLSN
tara:strand:- start:1703 stop:3958 length:2256 start_codon:yes stop_codon:yes gene_type:complete